MSHLPFIVGAYVATGVGALALVLQSWLSMRRAEAEAERLKK